MRIRAPLLIELAQEVLKPHWPVVRNLEENAARQKEVDRIVVVLRRAQSIQEINPTIKTLLYCGTCNQRRYFKNGECEVCALHATSTHPDLDVLMKATLRLKEARWWHTWGALADNCPKFCLGCQRIAELEQSIREINPTVEPTS